MEGSVKGSVSSISSRLYELNQIFWLGSIWKGSSPFLHLWLASLSLERSLGAAERNSGGRRESMRLGKAVW